jgi:hypothetical protein
MAISSSKDFIVFPNDNSGRVYVNEATYTASGTWTVPSGVSSAQVILVGAGGGGGGGSQVVAGGGGGGGQVITKNLTVVPGTTYSVTIGAGGQGGQGAQTSATDVVNTLPGSNGGNTAFGTMNIANYLTNALFEYGAVAWDQDYLFRAASGASGAGSITVFPNSNGITVGMYASGTNLGTSTQVLSVSGNVVGLSVVNAAAVNTIVSFNTATSILRPVQATYNAVSASVPTSNTQTIGSASAPYTAQLSNNLLPPRLSQFEDPTLYSGGFLVVKGNNPATLAITNAGLPTKLTEMIVPYTKTVTAASTSFTLTCSDTTNIQSDMFVTGSGISTGTVVLSVDSPTQVTISNATTGPISAATLSFSYTGSVGQYALLVSIGSSVTDSNPTWVNMSTLTGTASTTVGVLGTSAGYTGIPYQPGQTYTISAYVSSTVNIASTTPIKFQLRSAGASYGADTAANYLGGTNSGTANSIDAAVSNGFFVRQVIPTALAGYGGTVTTTATGSSASLTITVADASQLLIGQAITGAGIQSSTTIAGIAGTTVTLSQVTSAPLSVTTVTVQMPSGVQVLGSTVTVGQTGWRRISGTVTTPTIAAALANGIYAYGSTPQFIYPTLVFGQPSTNIWVDNVQLEVGSVATTWLPPLYYTDASVLLTGNSTTGGNLEAAHRFSKISPNTSYAGTAFVIGGGTSNTYRPMNAFLEYFDKDYNSLTRTNGTNTFLPITGLANSTQTNTLAATTYPVRVGVIATSPATAAYARFGVSYYQGSTSASTGVVEFAIVAPQLEAGATSTTFKRPNDGTYSWGGQAGASQIITAATVMAEGGGGGGTYNSNTPVWQWGIEGGNNGGHAGWVSGGTYQNMTLAGGGGGSFAAGGNPMMFTPTSSGSTTFSYSAGFGSSAGSTHQTFPMRGNNGGYAMWNTGSSNTLIPATAGEGGLGTNPSGLNSGSPLGLTLGGGGGGAGFLTNSQFASVPGRGNGGGGKGGGNYLVDLANNTNYYARGIDAIQNTGGGGGGGSTNQANAPMTPVAHAANAAINFDTANAEQYKWSPMFNATTQITSSAGLIATNGLRVTIQDVGNAKVQTTFTEFSILPRTPLFFTNIAARLTTAPAGATSTQFVGLSKRARPTVRWKTYDGQIIREDRPPYDILFSSTNTTTYLNGSTTIQSPWQTLSAPSNAAYFDVCWEFNYLDAGDVVDVDFGGLQYYANLSTGGNGADGLAIIRWFDKAVL